MPILSLYINFALGQVRKQQQRLWRFQKRFDNKTWDESYTTLGDFISRWPLQKVVCLMFGHSRKWWICNYYCECEACISRWVCEGSWKKVFFYVALTELTVVDQNLNFLRYSQLFVLCWRYSVTENIGVLCSMWLVNKHRILLVHFVAVNWLSCLTFVTLSHASAAALSSVIADIAFCRNIPFSGSRRTKPRDQSILNFAHLLYIREVTSHHMCQKWLESFG